MTTPKPTAKMVRRREQQIALPKRLADSGRQLTDAITARNAPKPLFRNPVRVSEQRYPCWLPKAHPAHTKQLLSG